MKRRVMRANTATASARISVSPLIARMMTFRGSVGQDAESSQWKASPMAAKVLPWVLVRQEVRAVASDCLHPGNSPGRADDTAILCAKFDSGVYVHTGRSGPGVYEFLSESGIILLSGDRLLKLLLSRELVGWRN